MGAEMPVGLANKQYWPQPSRGKSKKTKLGRQRQSHLTVEEKKMMTIHLSSLCARFCARQHTYMHTRHSCLSCVMES